MAARAGGKQLALSFNTQGGNPTMSSSLGMTHCLCGDLCLCYVALDLQFLIDLTCAGTLGL